MLTLQAAVATAERRANQTATVEALFELLFRQVTKLALTETPRVSKLRWQNIGRKQTHPGAIKLWVHLFLSCRVLKTCTASSVIQQQEGASMLPGVA